MSASHHHRLGWISVAAIFSVSCGDMLRGADTGDTGETGAPAGAAVVGAEAVRTAGPASVAQFGPGPDTLIAATPSPAASAVSLGAIQASVEMLAYQVRSELSGALVASNPRSGLDIRFASEGVAVSGDRSPEISLDLTSWGRLGVEQITPPVAPVPGACVVGEMRDPMGDCLPRVEYARPGLVEWWENRPAGLHQGFTVLAAPEALDSEPLAFTIAVRGGVAEVAADGSSAALRSEVGEELRYLDLVAWDSTGRELPAWMEESDLGVRLVVDDEGAVGVITVDPWVLPSSNSSILGTAVAGAGTGSGFGTSVAGAGDVNKDGLSDIVVGAPTAGASNTTGAAFLFLGSSTGWNTSPAWTGTGGGTGQSFGKVVAGGGDFNGDGFADWLVSAPGVKTVYVYLGKSASGGTLSAVTSVSLSFSSGTTTGFGEAAAFAGDLNNDGYSEVVVGCSDANCNPNTGQANSRGAVFIYRGAAAPANATNAFYMRGANNDQLGFGVSGAGDVDGDGFGDVVAGGIKASVRVFFGSTSFPATGTSGVTSITLNAGATVAGAGDTNGDGYADIVAATVPTNTGSSTSTVSLYRGSATRTSIISSPATFSLTTDKATNAPAVSGLGDVNGDGLSDFAASRIGASGLTTDLQIYYGSSLGNPATPVAAPVITGPSGIGKAFAVSGAGDVNGDGFADFVSGIGADNVANLYFGVSSGLNAASAISFSGTSAQQLGTSLASIGDVDGDGFGDVVVGAPSSTGAGSVLVYRGSATGLGTAPWQTLTLAGSTDFGVSVAGGDINGDGLSDIIVGDDTYTNTEASEGRVVVYLGSATTPLTTAWAVESNIANAAFGRSVAFVGDVNRDGRGDLLVGSHGNPAGGTSRGSAQLYLGTAAGPASSPSWTVQGTDNAWLGYTVAAAGDVNRDGYADVMIGAPTSSWQTSVSSVHIYHGQAGVIGLPAAANRSLSGPTNSGFGLAMGAANDVNGDTYGDIVIGAPRFNNGHSNEGAFYVLYGASGGIPSALPSAVESNVADDMMGTAVLGAGDVNGDGLGDLLIGAPGSTGTATGRTLLYFGGSTGLTTPALNPTQTGAAGNGARFGMALAGAADVNGDGYSDVVVGSPSSGTGAGRFDLYWGNAGDGNGPGLGVFLSARRELAGTLLAPGLRSDNGDSFVGRVSRVRGPWGSARVAVVYEVKPVGTAFDGSTNLYPATFAFDPSGTGLTVRNATFRPLVVDSMYHWRARLVVRPSAGFPQISTPWKYGGRLGDAGGVHVVTSSNIVTVPTASSVVVDWNSTLNAPYARATSVGVRFSAADPDGISAYCIDETNTCAPATALPAPTSGNIVSGTWAVTYTLSSPPEGAKMVYVRVKDATNVVSSTAAYDDIFLDATVPSFGTSGFSAATATTTSNTLTYDSTLFTDPGSAAASGLDPAKSILVMWAEAPSLAPACDDAAATTWFNIVTGVDGSGNPVNTTSFVHTVPRQWVNGHNYRMCLVDNAGNFAFKLAATVPQAPTAVAKSTTVTEDVVPGAANLLMEGTDPEGATITFQVMSGPSKGTLAGLSSFPSAQLSSGSLTYTPSANANGADSFTYRVNDGTLNSTTVTYTIDITPVNDAPTLTSMTTLTGATEDQAFSVSYTTLATSGNEADIDGDALSFRITGVSSGSVTVGGTTVNAGGNTSGLSVIASGQSFSWTPAANANGSALNAFTVRAFDGVLNSSSDIQVNVDVQAAPDAPKLTAVTTLTGAQEDTDYAITHANLTAAADEADPDGGTINFRVVAVSSGSVTIGSTTVVAGGNTSGLPLLSFANPLTWKGALNANGNGIDAFTVVASDGALESSPAVQVKIDVAPVNDAPVATDKSTTVVEDVVPGAANLLMEGTDLEGSALTFQVLTAPTKGTLSGLIAFPSGQLATGNLTYTPNANATGADSFTYRVNDGSLNSAAATYTVNISPVNDQPTLTAVTTLTGAIEDQAFSISYANLAANANEADIDGDALSFVITGVTSGSVTVGGSTVAAGADTSGLSLIGAGQSFTWTADANVNGTGLSAFTVKVYDGALKSATDEQVKVDVQSANDAPTLTTMATLTGAVEDTNYAITRANLIDAGNEADPDGHSVDFRVVAVLSGQVTIGSTTVVAGQSTSGLALITAATPLTWRAAPNANGTAIAAFTVVASDGALESTPAVQVQVDVTPVNDIPTLTQVTTLGPATEDTDYAISYAALLAAADEADVEGGPFEFEILDVASGRVVFDGVEVAAGGDVSALRTFRPGDPNLVWRAEPDAYGSAIAAFKIRVRDDADPSNAAVMVSVDVNAVNDAPVATGPVTTITVDENSSVNFTLTGTDTEGSPLTYAIATAPTKGVANVTAGTGAITFTPTTSVSGTDSFTFTVNDGSATSAAFTVNLSITDIDADNDLDPDTSDCNDGDATVHSLASEVCGDSIDQDCDGTPDDGCSSTWPAVDWVFIDRVTPALQNAPYTNSRTVSVRFQAHDNIQVKSYCLTTSGTGCGPTEWVNLASPAATGPFTVSYTLANVDGPTTLNLWVKDSDGQASAASESDAITLDRVAPVMSAAAPVTVTGVTVNGSNVYTNAVTLGVTYDVTDNYSLAASCFQWFANPVAGGTVPTECALHNSGTLAASGTLTRSLPGTTPADGKYTLLASFADEASGVTSTTREVVLDRTAPTRGTSPFTATAGVKKVTLAFNAAQFADPGTLNTTSSGFRAARLVYAQTTAPACTVAGGIAATGTSATLSNLTAEVPYEFALCLFDWAGNVTRVTATATPLAPVPPTISAVRINAGAPYTNSLVTTIEVDISDDSGPTEYCLTESTGACGTWLPMPAVSSGTATSGTWRLPYTLATTGDGLREVYVQVRDVDAAVSALDATTTPPTLHSDEIVLDTQAPEPKVDFWRDGMVVGGINSADVELRVLAVEPGGAPTSVAPITEYCLSHTASCTSGWEAYTGSAVIVPWTLQGSEGTYSVTLLARDALGNTASVTKSATIDTAPPSDGVMVVVGDGGTSLKLDWTPGSDGGGPGAGIAYYLVAMTEKPAMAPENCESGTQLAQVPDVDGLPGYTFIHNGLTPGQTYSYRVCAIDEAGNASNGILRTARAAVEYNPPTLSLTVNGTTDTVYSRSRAVTVGITVADLAGVSAVCVTAKFACGSRDWFPVTAAPSTPLTFTRSFSATGGSGTKTIYVRARDALGNAHGTPVTASFVYDVTQPPSPVLTVTTLANALFTMNWSKVTDAHSGLRGYQFAIGASRPSTCDASVEIPGSALASVTQGTIALPNTTTVPGSPSSFTSGTTYHFLACATDRAGNISKAAYRASLAKVEVDPPTGASVVIEGFDAAGASISGTDDAFTGRNVVSLTISGTDAGVGMGSMCVSATTSCRAWEAFATSKTFTLPRGTGARTVRVWLRDQLGNELAVPVQDSIFQDMTAPVNATILGISKESDGRGSVEWSAATDDAGVARYRIAFAPGTRAPPCFGGSGFAAEVAHSSGSSSYKWTTPSALTSGTYAVRVCAQDVLGTWSKGITASATLP